MLLQRNPESGKGFMIKRQAVNGETEPETLEDKKGRICHSSGFCW